MVLHGNMDDISTLKKMFLVSKSRSTETENEETDAQDAIST